MKLTKERAKKNLSKLIERFEREYSSGRIKEYNEEATKTSFIQPFLKEVLGWNVNDRDEVSPEEKISHGRVDYGLKVEGKIKIFIEAKPPKADLNRHIEQAVSYGYNRKGVPFVLLTDFEELKLFDVTVKPDSRNLRKGLKIDLRWDSYLEQFDKIWWFSRESVVKGELDQLLLVKPKERVPVDKAILEDLTRWRESLAKDIFRDNSELFHSGEPEKDADYLKEITQKILDRIIFMRFCEDRRLVHSRSLKELFEERTDTVGTNTMVFLKEEFRHYNIIFDSDLFRPQVWENSLAIDFKVMREIIEDTYHPYQFDVIPLEVLGNIYEQYLGYTIRLTDHQLRYEIKPEVRKAGGVYYTPEYIVDYIVKNTVGKLLQELPPKKIKKLRILDPACGSGSFLIRAYEEMLNYYRNQKKAESKSKEKQSQLKLRDKDAEPHLSIREKSRILREHIFGVDIDEQAVEVTKLSLMLKMLEGEHGMVHGRGILPMLDNNIKCGNSLISGDTLELKKYFGDDWYKVKPFNWGEEFKTIMRKEGGFDVVIGNPPYIQLSMEENLTEQLKKYLIKEYGSSMGRLNTFGFFLRLGINLLDQGGQLGFIIPNTLLTQDYYEQLRKMILDNCVIKNIVSFEDLPFKDAVIENIILIFKKTKEESKRKNNEVEIYDINELLEFVKKKSISQKLFQESYKSRFSIDLNEDILLLKQKIENRTKPLGGFLDINQAIALKHERSKWVTKEKGGRNSKPLLVGGKNINRYSLNWDGAFLRYDLKGIHSCKREDIFQTKQKLFFRRVSDRLIATLDENQFYGLHTLVVMNLKEGLKYNLKYFLALFNSCLLNFYYHYAFASTKKVFSEIGARQVAQLPIHTIDFTNPSEKKLHDDLVSLVDVMLDLNKTNQTAKGSKKEQIQRQIEKTDKEIDEIVYKLYGITEKERKIIEGEVTL